MSDFSELEREVTAVLDSTNMMRRSIVGGYILLSLSFLCFGWLIIQLAALYQGLPLLRDLQTAEEMIVYKKLTHFYTGVVISACVFTFIIYSFMIIFVSSAQHKKNLVVASLWNVIKNKEIDEHRAEE